MFNDFRDFWPSYFTSLFEKVIYNFCKVRGLIDRFIDSCSNIASGLRKRQMSQRVSYDYVPPLKEIYLTTLIFLGSWIHWDQIRIK